VIGLASPPPWRSAAPSSAARRWLRPVRTQHAALRVPMLETFRGAEADAAGPRFPRRMLFMLWLAWLLLLSAAARPQHVGEAVSLPVSGRDLMLAVDISGSMQQKDLQLGGRAVARIAVVKRVVSDFIDRRAGDRMGLVLFGTQAYLQAPLTFDRATLQRLLDEAPIGIAGGKTAIGDAIGLAVKRLRDRPEHNRVLVLLTDGANNVGEVQPRTAAELAAQAGVTIYTVGIGTERGEPSDMLRFRLGGGSDLDEETLAAIAETTGGRYFRARSTTELAEIYRILDALEPIAQPDETWRPVRELFHWPLALALALSLALAAGHGGASSIRSMRARQAERTAS